MKLFLSSLLIFLFLLNLKLVPCIRPNKRGRKKFRSFNNNKKTDIDENIENIDQILYPNAGDLFPRYMQLGLGNENKNRNKMNTLNMSSDKQVLKTFGFDDNMTHENKITYRQPIYVGDGNYKPFSKDDQETKFLETSSGDTVSGKQKEIDFNSNQVYYEPGTYRKAFVIGEKKEKEVLTVVGSSRVKNVTFTKGSNPINITESFNQTKAIDKFNMNIFNNRNNSIHNLHHHTPIDKPKLFNNENEIENLSFKLANFIKNILLDVVSLKENDKNYNVDNMIQNKSHAIQNMIKTSLVKMKKENDALPKINVTKNILKNKQKVLDYKINSFFNKSKEIVNKSESIEVVKMMENYSNPPIKDLKHKNHSDFNTSLNNFHLNISHFKNTSNLIKTHHHIPMGYSKDKLPGLSLSTITHLKTTNISQKIKLHKQKNNNTHTIHINDTFFPIKNITSEYVKKLNFAKNETKEKLIIKSKSALKNNNLNVTSEVKKTQTNTEMNNKKLEKLIQESAKIIKQNLRNKNAEEVVNKIEKLKVNPSKMIDNSKLIANNTRVDKLANSDDKTSEDVDDASIISDILKNFAHKLLKK